MDSDIKADSICVNDFTSFFRSHENITHVFFNGTMAEQSFQKYVRPILEHGFEHRPLHYLRLPSTSPANASMSYAQKLDAWKVILPGHP